MNGSGRSNPRRGLLAALLGLTLLGCGEAESPAPTRVRLLEGLDAATFEGRAQAWLAGGAVDTDEVLVRSDFDSQIPGDWFEGIWEKHGAQGKQRPRVKTSQIVTDPEEQGPVAVVWSHAQGLHRLLPVTARDTYVITARVKAPQTDDSPTIQLWGRGFADRIPADEDPARIRKMKRPEPAQTWPPTEWNVGDRVATAVAPRAWQTLRVVLPPQRGRQTLRVSVQAQDGGVLVDHVEVRRLGKLAVLTGVDSSAERDVRQLRRKVSVGSSTRDSLILPTGSSVTFPVRVPELAPRLDVAATLLADRSTSTSTVGVRINGQTLANSSWPIDPDGFRSWTVSLEAWRGQSVQLSMDVGRSGETGDAVAVIAVPELLGRGGSRSHPNLLLISLDTLRADALGCYGQSAPVSPNLDRLAETGVRFERVYSPASYTLPSHATMMSGQHPLLHGALESTDRLSVRRSPLLARRLQDTGACTAAFTGGGFVHPSFGFGQGFDSYDVRDPGGVPHRFVAEADGAGDPMAPVLEWLDRHQDQSWFLFVHTYLIHNFVADPEFYDGLPAAAVAAEGRDAAQLWRDAEEDLDEVAASELHRRYLATVAQADRRIVGTLLQRLQEHGLSSDTVVVVTSDHGEEFLEHGALGHGRFLWEESVRVPWLLNAPGLEPQTVEGLASLEDVSVTVASVLGLPPVDGVSGLDLLAQPRSGPILLHMQHRDRLGLYHWEGAIEGPTKLLRQGFGDATQPRTFLYRLDWDPAELHDLGSRLGEPLKELVNQLDERSAEYLRLVAPFVDEENAALSPEVLQGLSDLGYVR